MVGNVPIGGGADVVIQSMLNTKTTDVEGSLAQIRSLASAGCQIARLAVPNMEAARGFAEICKESVLPLVADIHFDYRLAIAAAEGGASPKGRRSGPSPPCGYPGRCHTGSAPPGLCTESRNGQRI